MIEGKVVVCELRGHDRYRRSIGLCRADGQDLGAAMVEQGMAWAFTRYSSDYVGQERAAIGAKVGVHAHDCEKAWDWRPLLSNVGGATRLPGYGTRIGESRLKSPLGNS
jgi:endonuclease YncB( thermonuclease family)